MSRTEAKKQFNTQDLNRQTEGVECRKDKGVIDEIPGAYKDIGPGDGKSKRFGDRPAHPETGGVCEGLTER